MVSFRALLLAIALLSALPVCAQESIVINEFVSSNVDGRKDEDGDATDWIELHNPTAVAVDVEGWALSDDPADPTKFIFPPTVIEPDGYLLVYASGKDRRVQPRGFSTLVGEGARWRWLPGTVEPPATWADSTFDDSSWARGPSGFGFGDGDDRTVVQDDTVYVRLVFDLTAQQLAAVQTLYLHVDYDDGFVAYLNGAEVARENIGMVGERPAHDDFADGAVEAKLYQGSQLSAISLADAFGILTPGTNVLAIQVHNASAASSDLSLIPFLTVGLAEPIPALPQADPRLRIPDHLLHTDFKISAEGETLVLTDRLGTEVDRVETGRMWADLSRGRHRFDPGAFYWFQVPTPGRANGLNARPRITDPPTVTPDSGSYSGPVTVSMSHPEPGVVIRYTRDGSKPTQQSVRYNGPLTIDKPVSILRARAFDDREWPSRIETRTFLQGISRPLPIASVVADPVDLWDPETGIYTKGTNYFWLPPFFGANFWMDWEKPAHLDLLQPDGSLSLSQDFGLKIHGGWSRSFAQKSLRLLARTGYGESRFDYPVFGAEGLPSFRRLILRNAGTDWCKAHVRDALVQELLLGLDLDMMDFQPALVLLNGEYWGVQHLRERVDQYWCEDHHDADPDAVDILENFMEVKEGDAAAWRELDDFVQSHDLSNPADFAWIAERVDLAECANYHIAQVFMGNTDWPQNNIKYWRKREPGAKWRWILYDTDFALGDADGPDKDTLHRLVSGPIPDWSVRLFRGLLENDEFRFDFINRYADLLNTRFRPSVTSEVVDRVVNQIKPEMEEHQERWGYSYTYWQNEIQKIADYLLNRPIPCGQHIEREFQLAGHYSLGLDIQPPGAGKIELAVIAVDEAWNGKYYLGVPVRLRAVPSPGYAFAGWSDPTVSQTEEIQIDPPGAYSIAAKFVATGGGIVINEINYNAPASFDPGDWVELHNGSTALVDLSGWRFEDSANSWTLPLGTVLAPGQFLVLAEDLVEFQQHHPQVSAVLGDLGFGLSGSGEKLSLYDAAGTLLDTVDYDDKAPWPTGPDGGGPTLELYQPSLDNSLAASWRESLVQFGTPAAKNSVTP